MKKQAEKKYIVNKDKISELMFMRRATASV